MGHGLLVGPSGPLEIGMRSLPLEDGDAASAGTGHALGLVLRQLQPSQSLGELAVEGPCEDDDVAFGVRLVPCRNDHMAASGCQEPRNRTVGSLEHDDMVAQVV